MDQQVTADGKEFDSCPLSSVPVALPVRWQGLCPACASSSSLAHKTRNVVKARHLRTCRGPGEAPRMLNSPDVNQALQAREVVGVSGVEAGAMCVGGRGDQ